MTAKPNQVAAGVPPAVEPGILPGGQSARDSLGWGVFHLVPGGGTPPSTAGGTPAATGGDIAKGGFGWCRVAGRHPLRQAGRLPLREGHCEGGALGGDGWRDATLYGRRDACRYA
jgi:hypothetical protein